MADDDDPADWLASQFGAEPTPAATPPTPPAARKPAEPEPEPEPNPGTSFNWGLTPGGDAAAAPFTPPIVTPAAVEPPALITPAELPASPMPPVPSWDTPTVASPVIRDEPEYLPPTTALPRAEVARQEFPGFGVPLDPALDGPTELIGAQAVGLPTPEAEGLGASPLDDLFGEASFADYDDALIPALPPRGSTALAVIDRGSKPPRPPIPTVQKVLMWVAGGLLAALALVGLFLLGTKIAKDAPAPAVAESPSPSATPSQPGVLPLGPVANGDHNWSELLGGECIQPYTDPWQDTYAVVDCGTPHQAQMVHRGLFPDDSTVVYPGGDELQKRLSLLCTPPTIIDYTAAGGATDIQVSGSFAADEQDWQGGNRTYFCFVSRANGAQFTTSIAMPQVAAPAPVPTP